MAGERRISGRDELSRALRETAGLSQVDAGRRALITQRKVSRFEAGLYVPNDDELAALLGAYGTGPSERARLLALAGQRRAEGRTPRAVIRRLNYAAVQHNIRLLEEKSSSLQGFHPATVIGLLQTPDYIRAVWGDAEGAADAVAERLERQRQIATGDRTCTFTQTEGALRRHLGNPQVMAGQMDSIAAAARSGNVRVGIIPWSQPMDFTVVTGFHIYDRDTVVVGTTVGPTLLTDAADLDEYLPLFDRLERLAVFGDRAAEIARRIAEDYRRL